jgi:transketolase
MTLATTSRPDELMAALRRLTGDEKHAPAAFSTLDVTWVLYDASEEGRTHQSPGDVALIDTLDGTWTVHVPGHPDEVAPLLRATASHDDSVYVRLSTRTNRNAHPDADKLRVLKRGSKATVVAVGPMLDPVLEATEGLDVTVAYTHTPRPFEAPGCAR